MLNENQHFNLDSYVEELTKKYHDIKSIWLFGSRANNSYNNESDWDLLVFEGADLLNRLKDDLLNKRDNIDLLVVQDGNNFKSPWPREDTGTFKIGQLDKWKWTLLNDKEAQYTIDAGLRDVKESGEDVFYTPREEV